jgi:hypothetical protein
VRIPILTYQAMRIAGNDYANNDLKALAADLRQLTDAGFRIVPLRTVVDLWLGNRGAELNGKLVALACNGGADFDYLDLAHPTAGTQRSVLNTLRDFAAEYPGRQEQLNITSFVIASPEARAVLDRTCMVGKGWWTDAWWKAAIESGLMHLGSHSWDHNHETLPDSLSPGVRRGTFLNIDSKERADYEVRQAAAYLDAHAPNPGTALFAYPYGQANRYLSGEYFACHGGEFGARAAFTDQPDFLEPGCDRWAVPRFVCGRDWSSPDGLRAILEEAARAEGRWVVAARRTAKVMTPPRERAVDGARRTKPSRLEVGFAPPDAEKPSRGLVPLAFEIDGPPGSGELALKVESALVYAKKFELRDDRIRLATFLNTHFLRNGTNRLEASVTHAGKAAWSEAFVLNVSNAGPIADRVRASLREHGTPMVLEGSVDSSAFDIAAPSLAAWFDRPDALSHLEAMRESGAVTREEAAALRQFVEEGYAILPTPVEESLLETVNHEIDDAIEKKVDGYEYGTSQRVQHLHRRYPGVSALWRHPMVMRYLELIFGVPPRACQTLTYIFGSQQGAHQDTIHLTPFPAGYMCGVWIALEDVQPDSGELEVYKGSHRLPRVYMHGSDCAKVTNDDWNEFGDTVAARWREMLAEGRFEKMTYRPKRGTILIWHENLMHGGSVRIDQSLSRRSIVSHYFADGAIAFYDSTGVAGHME